MNAPEIPSYCAIAPGRRPRQRGWTALAVLVALVQFLYVGRVSAQATDASTAVHFLEQATFGPTALEVANVQAIGPAAWIQNQLAMPESPVPDGLDGNAVRAQVYLNMANGPDQLRQRAIFALSQTIVVSANKVGNGEELIPWMRLLSRNAFGNFQTVLRDVSLSPTMGKYLDNVYNRKATTTTSPNENYARELLQLFSLGTWELNNDGSQKLDGGGNPIPAYSQATIAAFARALTGWTYPPRPGATSGNSNPEYFVGELVPTSSASRHDTDPKTLLNGLVTPAGNSAMADLSYLIDNIFYHPNVPPFIATRLIRSLVSSNPSPAYVNRVSNVFINNGAGVRGDLAAVFAAILLDPEALNPDATLHGRLKDPILHVMGLGRALNAQLGDPGSFQVRVLEPESARAHALHGLQLLLADREDPDAAVALRPRVPALSAGAGDPARQLHLRHPDQPVRVRLQRRHDAVPRAGGEPDGARGQGQHHLDDGSDDPAAAPDHPQRDHRGAGKRHHAAGARRRISGGDLE